MTGGQRGGKGDTGCVDGRDIQGRLAGHPTDSVRSKKFSHGLVVLDFLSITWLVSELCANLVVIRLPSLAASASRISLPSASNTSAYPRLSTASGDSTCRRPSAAVRLAVARRSTPLAARASRPSNAI